MKPAFINLSLCDNDFGWQLEWAARQFHEEAGQGDIICASYFIKEAVIELVCAKLLLSDVMRNRYNDTAARRTYLTQALMVDFHKPPDGLDHDGGSVCIDRNLNYIWRY